MNDKTKNIISWVIAIALAAFMALASSGKLAGGMIEQFENWGYSATFSYIIGALELAGAIGLLIKPLRPFAAIGLIGIMIGAAYTHFTHDEFSAIGANLGVIIACVALIFTSKKSA